MEYDLNYRCKPVIPDIPKEQFLKLSDKEQLLYLKLKRESVTRIFEKWRKPYRIKMCCGGRGSAAKSESTASLLIQIMEYTCYFGENLKILCLRRVQNSIKDSSKSLFERKIKELGYTDFTITNDYIRNNNHNSIMIFKGLNEYSVDNLKSLNDISICFIEECASIDSKSWDLLIPSIRKTWIYNGKEYTSEIWGVANLETNNDPFYERFYKVQNDNWLIQKAKPFGYDNEHYPQVLIDAYKAMKEQDPDEAEHQFIGTPRNNQENSVWNYSDVENARDRVLGDESGAVECGVDIARSAKGDFTVAAKRKGLRVLEIRKVKGYNTQDVAGMVADLVEYDKSIPLKIDQGGNAGVLDLLIEWGYNVIPVLFGNPAENKDVYANCASEMMFELPLKEMSIPSEYITQDLIEDLCERKYFYNSKGQKQLEPKDDRNGTAKTCFKNRHNGRSPDEGDSLCLCFYERKGTECF